ncbi:MAG: multidrug ABC transporter [Gracilibacteraceae bacterium]|nr:multidrug ABC transporter [Gracilibacteraceae bacterium]
MNNWVYMGLFVAVVFVSSCVQVVLKLAANKRYAGIKAFINKYTVVGYAVFAGATFCSVLLYRHIALSTGVLLDSTGYIFIQILGCLALKEKTSGKHLLGMALIIAGLAVYTLYAL